MTYKDNVAILIHMSGGIETTYELTGDSFSIGRAGASDICLTEKAVSGEHAKLIRTPNGWTIRDEKSRNNTQLNRRDIKGKGGVKLHSGDQIRICNDYFEFYDPADSEEMGSVSCFIVGIKNDESKAAEHIFHRYFDKLTQAARRKLQDIPHRAFDGEDVAISAMHSLVQGAAAGRFDKLNNRDDLWALLLTIARNKAVDGIRAQNAKKRGNNEVQGESVFNMDASGSVRIGLQDFPDSDPTPEELVQLDEIRAQFLQRLPNDKMRRIVVLRLEGYSIAEIAKQLDCSSRWVERNLQDARDIGLDFGNSSVG